MIVKCHLLQLATTFLMGKIKVGFMMFPDSEIICFALFFNKKISADTQILSCHENKQKGYKKWLKLLEME